MIRVTFFEGIYYDFVGQKMLSTGRRLDMPYLLSSA